MLENYDILSEAANIVAQEGFAAEQASLSKQLWGILDAVGVKMKDRSTHCNLLPNGLVVYSLSGICDDCGHVHTYVLTVEENGEINMAIPFPVINQ